MQSTFARRSLLALSIVFVALLSSRPAGTLIYMSGATKTGQQLLLRRDGDRLVLVNQQSRAIVASAPAGSTERVVIAGAADRDDTLTLDLSSPISLRQGIDYDGGARGWDTLVVTGGSVQKETVTQLSPHDGVFDLDGLALRYTNLEPVTDTVPAASLTVSGTGGQDSVTIADGPGAGQATISSPTFESYTFANKTDVVFDGLGGGDSVTLDNPSTPAGLMSLIIQNVDTVGQISPFTYPRFGVSADSDVILDQVGANNVNNIEIVTQNGGIGYRDADAVTIGGVSPLLTGLRVVTDGGISFVTGGTITLRDLDGADIVHSGDASGGVEIVADGSGADIDIPFNNKAITSPAGFIHVTAGGDINVGTGGDDFDNDILASGDVTLNAGRDILISGSSEVFSDAFGNATGGTATANASRDFLLSNTTGANARFGSNGLGGGTARVFALGSLILTAPTADALVSASGPVEITASRVIIDPASGISAPLYVLINSTSGTTDFGSTTDAGSGLELSDAEADRVTSPFLLVEGLSSLTVTQPITSTAGLGLLTAGTFSSAGAGSLNAPVVQFQDLGGAPRTWTINATGVTATPGTVIPYSGVTTLAVIGGSGDDTFDVTPAASTMIVVTGRSPDLPTLPGDVFNIDISGTTSPFLTSEQSESGFQGNYTFANRTRVEFSDVETLNAATDLAITKTDGASVETPGSSVTYTITATNSGPLGMAGVRVMDAFPAALTGVTWTCTASAGSTCPANGAGSLDAFVDLAAGGTAAFTVTGTINVAATGALSNTATIDPPAGANDPSPGNNSATDTDTLLVLTALTTNASAGIVLGGQVHDTATLAGGSIPTGTITFNLYGPNDATCSGAAAFTNAVPVAGNGSYDSANFTPALPGTYRWIAVYSGDATNAASAGACNAANESVTVTQTADVAVTKTGPATVVAGSNITYTIMAANSGPNAAAGATVTDTLPPGTTLVSATPTQGSCSGTSTVTCSLGTIVNGGTATVTLVVSTSGATLSSISNTATVSTTSSDPVLGNNSSTANTTRTCPTLAASPAVLPPATAGDPYSQTFALLTGTAPATFTLTGTLPAGLSFASPELSGVPTERGAFPVTLNATDANGCTGSFTYTVTISRDRSLVVGAGEGGGSGVRSFGVFSWTPRLDVTLDPPFLTGGISVAQADINGDGITDVVTGGGPGNDPVVRVIDGATGTVRFTILAYAPTYRSGIEVAAGDVNGDGIVDIITVPGYGGPPVVRVFNSQTGAIIREFFGMAPTWTNGLHVAAGDVNGDGLADIIVGSGPFGPPLVQVFDSASGALMGQFLAYDANVQSGVYVASGDVNGDGFADIVTGPGYGGGPHVKVFDGTTGDPIAGPLGGFFAYTPDFAGGVRVGAGDFDGDGFAEVITSAGPGGGPHVRVWDGATGAETYGVYAFDPSFPYGAFVAGPPAVGRMAIDLLQVGGATPNIRIAGWAFEGTTTAGPGTDAIHAWAYPVGGGAPVFVGAATSRAPRPDVAARFGGEALLSGFDFTGTLAAGTYDLVIFVRNDTTHLYNLRQGGRITVP